MSIVQISEFIFNLRKGMCDESYTSGSCSKNTIHGPEVTLRAKSISTIFSRIKSIKRKKIGKLINSDRENVIKLQIKCLFLTFKMGNILCVTNELNFYRHKLGKVYVTYTSVKFVKFFTRPFKNTFVSFAAHDTYSYC